jgi:hypothetical protein
MNGREVSRLAWEDAIHFAWEDDIRFAWEVISLACEDAIYKGVDVHAVHSGKVVELVMYQICRLSHHVL